MIDFKAIQTTMIGSVPHKDTGQAFSLLKKYPLTLPAWPQFPKMNFKEAMIPQYSEGFPGIKVDEKNKRIWLKRGEDLLDKIALFLQNVVEENLAAFAVTPDYALGLHLFIDKLKHNGRKYKVLKGQVTGPFTFGLGMNDENNKAIWFDKQYRDVVVNGLKMKALWQAKELKKYAEMVVIFFDEPIFSALGTPAYIGIEDEQVLAVINELVDALHDKGIMVGIHCCGNMDWGLLARTELDIIAFDAYFYGQKLALYAADINSFLKRGGILAWGIVPTSNAEKLSQESCESLKTRLHKLVQLFVEKRVEEQHINERLLLTPSCGLGSGTLTEEQAERVLDLLNQLKE